MDEQPWTQWTERVPSILSMAARPLLLVHGCLSILSMVHFLYFLHNYAQFSCFLLFTSCMLGELG